MKNKSNLLIISLLISIGLFIYLTVHHYAVQLGTNEAGLCSISSTLNCDAAASSRYSELFSIPIAVLGLCFNLVMLVLLLFKKLDWSESTETQNGFVRSLFLISAFASIALAGISAFQIKVLCPFCIATYIFAFVNLYLVWSVFSPAKYHPIEILSDKGTWVAGITILLIAWFISGTIQDKYGLADMRRGLNEKINLWQMSPVHNFDVSLGLVKNPQGTITVTEFADYKCPHCKVAAQSLKSFMQDRSDVKLIFKSFALDGTCNPHVQFKGDGSRCKMATWSFCAEKIAQKGWDVSYWYFDRQESLISVSDMTSTNQEIAQSLNLNYEEIEQCAVSKTAYDEIKKMADEAIAAGVQGTPAVYLNGKKVEMRADHLPIGLKAIINTF